MNDVQAAEQLLTIRTLMERSALYRRALGPTMRVAGLLGTVGAGLGWGARFETAAGFAGLWMAVALLAVTASLVVVRRQALRDGEPFWSPPTRRVALALLPPFLVGGMITVPVLLAPAPGLALALAPAWLVLYGCGLHAAGFFTPRGIRRLAWLFLAAGLAAAAAAALGSPCLPGLRAAHLWMGATFGLGQLAYGFYVPATGGPTPP